MNSAKTYFVTAIHTDSGKTLSSAIIATALQADYWKPIQSGLPKDATTIQELVSYPIQIHRSAYEFRKPASPHDAAEAENCLIDLNHIQVPQTENHLVVEGAGGILVPLNAEHFVIDIAQKFGMEIILVINIYLGCINHSLLSIQELKRRSLSVKGIIFNGERNKATEDIILHYSGYPCLLRIEQENKIDKDLVESYAQKIRANIA
ncbi:MAG: dethiobiotin synthase [Thermonemataceae bacterium]|nr:dethiobiotin synthase [Thermonemataceae bacterium]